jgi:hypothetical protein
VHDAVVVGDRVTLEWEADRAAIDAVAPRRSAFSRRAGGSRAAASFTPRPLACRSTSRRGRNAGRRS